MSRKKKPVNNSGIPQHIIESIARCILPDIIAYYETEEGQRQFQEWKAMQEAEYRICSRVSFCGSQVLIPPGSIKFSRYNLGMCEWALVDGKPPFQILIIQITGG